MAGMKGTLAKYAVLIIVAAGAWGADWYTKMWAQHHLKGMPPVIAVPGVVDLGYSENRGMVFGIMNDSRGPKFAPVLQYVRMVIFGAVTLFIVFNRARPCLFLLPFLLVWAGAVGNLVDSFSRGYVVDFIHLRMGRADVWPFLFNLADAYLVAGMGLLLIRSFTDRKKRR